MAKSKAQKQRAHAVRNGKRDPELSRGVVAFSTHVRRTPTLHERMERQTRKHRAALYHAQ